MRKILFVVVALGLVLVSKVNAADESVKTTEIKGQKDFSQEYLETVKDEKAVEFEAAREAREDHDRYMRKIARQR